MFQESRSKPIIPDKIIIRTCDLDCGPIYAFDEKGNYTIFSGYEVNGKSFYIKNASVNGNTITIESLLIPYDGTALCSICAKDDYIYNAVEKITYKNGKFSNRETISTTTVKEFRTSNDKDVCTDVDMGETYCDMYELYYGNEKEEIPANLEELDVNSNLVKNLFDDIRFEYDNSCEGLIYYSLNKLIASQLTDKQITLITAKKLLQGKYTAIVSKDVFEKTAKQLFGQDIDYTFEEVEEANAFEIKLNNGNVTINFSEFGDILEVRKLSYIY